MSYSKKTYSRKGGGGAKGNPFDRMMKEQCNKPVAAKSAGIVGEEADVHVLYLFFLSEHLTIPFKDCFLGMYYVSTS